MVEQEQQQTVAAGEVHPAPETTADAAAHAAADHALPLAEAAPEVKEEHRSASGHDMEAQLRRIKCDITISNHVTASVGAGFIPLPVVDFAAVTGVQMDLLYRLCKIYGVDFSKEAARSVITALIGASVPALQARFLSSSLKLIPVVGTIAGMFATPAVSAAATYAVGKVFVNHLDTGGTLLTFDARKMKDHFERALRQGKDMASRTAPSAAKA